MGCATQELTAAAPQQQNEKLTTLPPNQNTVLTHSKSATGPTTKLKESHSALVKLLESAPISTPAPSPVAAPSVTNSHSNNRNVNMKQELIKTNHHHHYRKKMVNLLEHIKNSDSDISKILESKNCSQNTSDNNVRQNSGSSSEEDMVEHLPWKKTRTAREWRQKKQLEAKETVTTPTVVVSPPQPELNTHNEQITTKVIGESMKMDTDEDEEDMCEHILQNIYQSEDQSPHMCRRNSLESCSDGCQNDSGCDSDCPDNNINELCKRFDENLSDEDGFFRRSIQQKIQYRPCTKNQQCSILRINRNRCQYCRLKKCIAVGMSRDAVRFGRVPKREKARILAAMQQSTQNRGNQRALATELDDQPRLLASVLRAHMETCEFTREKVTQMRQRARDCPTYSMPTLACPLNPAPELQSEQEFSQRFAHVIRGVIDFAGMIPGFQMLTQDDKFTLLKAGLFDALFVRLICMFDSSINSIICLNGQVMRRDSIQNGANARFLVDSTFNFAERMNSMQLTDAEIGLFCAIVLITPDRPGLRNVELIERMYSKLKACLQSVITSNRPDKPEFMQELLKTLPDLRTLSTLHTEKLVVFRTEHKELLRQQMWTAEEEAASKSPGSSSWGCDGSSSVEDIAKSPMGSVSSTESGDTYCSSDYTSAMTAAAPLLAASLSGGCPMLHRASSGSSAEDDIVGAAHLAQNGLTITPVVRAVPITAHHIRYRKLDSPTDSGIESGNEKHEHHKVPSSGSSSCSSPRSSLEDQSEDKRHIVEDMPVLKRVLQAPPLYDTNSLMDEAYKPHKKFRAMRHRESETDEPQSSTHQSPMHQPHQSQLHMHLTRPQSHSSSASHHHHQQQQQQQHQQQQQQQQHHQQQTSSSLLSSTHSVLAKSLMAEPRMTPEQMKRSDIIQNYIMRESQQQAAAHHLQHGTSGSSLFKSTIMSSPHHSSSAASSPSTISMTSSNQQQGLLVCTSASASSSPQQSAGCPYSNGRWHGNTSVITTTNRQQTPSPPNTTNTDHQRYFQSPHSTSTSPPGATSSPAPSPRLLELQVDCIATGATTTVLGADHQPLNLSKKSPSPPPRNVVGKA